MLDLFPQSIVQAFNKNDPSQIVKYLIDLAQAFNKYYGKVRILEENEEKHSRLALTLAVTIVIKEGLRLLGITTPEEM